MSHSHWSNAMQMQWANGSDQSHEWIAQSPCGMSHSQTVSLSVCEQALYCYTIRFTCSGSTVAVSVIILCPMYPFHFHFMHCLPLIINWSVWNVRTVLIGMWIIIGGCAPLFRESWFPVLTQWCPSISWKAAWVLNQSIIFVADTTE